MGTRVEPLNEHNFTRYLKENGKEKAEGYLEALEDITIQIRTFFSKQIGEDFFTNTPSGVRKKTKDMVIEKAEFLNKAKQILKELKLD